jgi:diguanylate cyclase (GGDEF)-like protein
MRRVAWWFLAVCGVLATVSIVLPTDDLQDALYAVLCLAGLVAVLVGVRRNRPRGAAGWYLMVGGLALWLLHDAVYTALERAGIDPFGSGANLIALAGYPLLFIGLLRIDATRTRTADSTNVVDSLLITCAAALPIVVLIIQPAVAQIGNGGIAPVVAASFAVCDLLLVAMVAQVAMASHPRCASAWLLAASLIAFVFGDLIFGALGGMPVTRLPDASLDMVWIAGYLLWGAAALHPSMVLMSERHVPRDASVSMTRLYVIAGALASTVLTVITGRVDGATLVTFALVAITLVTLRMLWMVRRLRDQATRLARLAETDVLTGLENRRRFATRMEDLFAGPAPAGGAVLLIALERYTEISDTLGHRVGHELLCAVGDRLAAGAGRDGHLARLGGDSFAIILPGVEAESMAEACADRLRVDVAQPFALTEVTVSVNAVVGIALASSDADDGVDLMRKADIALSAARERAQRVARYAEQMEGGGPLTPQLMGELRQAMVENQVVLYYQPQVELLTGRVLGVEALVRWQHPVHGLLAPDAFVPAAERTGLIRLLTLHVLDRALAQSALWRAAGLALRVSVNLSVRDLLDPDFAADVRRALDRHKIVASTLELEITETMAMVDPNRSVEVLGVLDAMGVHLAVDDYGTGYSSLAYLQRLPVRRLKIDRSFVAGVLDDSASGAIVRSTIELARHLGLSVVAEGVEDDATMLALLDMRCVTAQGFGLGRPVEAEEIPALVGRIESRVPEVIRSRVPEQRRDEPARR